MTSQVHHKLSVPQVSAEWYHKLFTFNGTRVEQPFIGG